MASIVISLFLHCTIPVIVSAMSFFLLNFNQFSVDKNPPRPGSRHALFDRREGFAGALEEMMWLYKHQLAVVEEKARTA